MIQESIRRHRRRKRMVQGILVAIVIFAAVATILFFSTDLTRITVTGTTYIPQETAAQMVFSTRMEKRTFYARFCDLFGRKKDLPMIRSYELIFDGMNAVTVEVEEEPVVCGIRYVDSYLYFDQEGYLLSSGKEPIEDVVLLEGIVIRQPMLYKQIQTEEQDLLERISFPDSYSNLLTPPTPYTLSYFFCFSFSFLQGIFHFLPTTEHIS